MERKDVEKLAQLARIDMSVEEMDEFLGSIGPVLDYVAQLQSVSTEKRESDYAGLPFQQTEYRLRKGEPYAGDIYNVMREDANPNESGMYTEIILAEAPATQDGYLKVKQIL